MNKNKMPLLSIVLYILASLSLIYTIWSAIHSYKYISNMISYGQLVIRGNEYNIVNFYMSNGGQYGFFTILLVTLAQMMQKISFFLSDKLTFESDKLTLIKNDEERDEDCEEWFYEDV